MSQVTSPIILDSTGQDISAKLQAIANAINGGTIDPLTVTQNGTYTPSGTTLGYGPVTVNVGGTIISGTTMPTSAQGSNGSIYLKYLGLPEGYTLREYIESSGTQYIDLGIPARIGFKTVIDAQFTGNTDQTLLGGNGDDNNKIYLGGNPADNNCLYMRFRTGIYWELINSAYDKNRHIYESYIATNSQHMKKDSNTILSTSYSLTASTPTTNLFLFSRPGGTNAASAKLYGLKIFDLSNNDTLIMDLLPCTRNSDNEPGMYDIINNNFYANAGSGVFSIGSVAANVIEQSYAKVNGTWQNLIGTDINDINLGS